MSSMHSTVHYCCVARGNRTLYVYSRGDHEIENSAALCLESTPSYHKWYFETIAKKTFGFLIEDGSVYFTIVDEGLGHPSVLQFLEHVRDEFKKVARKGSRGSFSGMNSINVQEQLVPVICSLITSLEHVVCNDWAGESSSSDNVGLSPSPLNANEQIEVVNSTKAPLLGKSNKQDKRKSKEHAFIMFLMLILLAILSFSALAVPVNTKYFQYKYNKKYGMALKEDSNETSKREDRELKEDITKFWMMAHTCNPQFVVGRSVTCTAAGAFCLLVAMTLAEAMLRSYLMPWSFKFCTGESDYEWSTILILITQTIAVGVGTIAPAIRWFTAVNFRCPIRRKKSGKRKWTVERYWIQLLVEMKDCPLSIRFEDRFCKKFAHGVKNKLLDLCIGMQTGIVLGSKVIQFISVYFMIQILLFCDFCKKLTTMKPKNGISSDSGSESRSTPKPDLRRYVMHLEGEEELVELMMKNNFDATDHWLRRGERKQPKHLTELLEKSTFAEGFKGVREFDSDLVLSLVCDEPPNCWALPVVTLTAIAVALPNASGSLMKQLMRSVNEGLMYVRLVEDNLDAKGELLNIRKAANVAWVGVDLFHKWLDVDLRKLSFQAESTKEILEKLSDAAKNSLEEFKKTPMNQCLREGPSKWPIKILAANSMYRISQTLLQNCERRNDLIDEKLFEALTVMISDILGACLTNLRLVIFHCLSRAVTDREHCVRRAVFLLGKTEKIRKLLDQQPISTLDPDQMACIDKWRSKHDLKISLPSIPSSAKRDTALSTSSDLYITME